MKMRMKTKRLSSFPEWTPIINNSALEQSTIRNQNKIAIETPDMGTSPGHISNITALPGIQFYKVANLDLPALR
jgi:hypothetical protein